MTTTTTPNETTSESVLVFEAPADIVELVSRIIIVLK